MLPVGLVLAELQAAGIAAPRELIEADALLRSDPVPDELRHGDVNAEVAAVLAKPGRDLLARLADVDTRRGRAATVARAQIVAARDSAVEQLVSKCAPKLDKAVAAALIASTDAMVAR